MSKKSFIQDLYTRRSTFHDTDQAEMMSNLLGTVSSDIYSESQRFIFELIQNADDAASGKANEMLFDFHTDCLIVSHNGRPFDEEDIKAITHAGKGTKESDQSKTGYKGIGFKSVFGKSNKVSIYSGGFNFRFDRKFIKQSFNGAKMPWQIIPVWTNENELSESAKSIVSNGYNVSTVIELKNTNGLQNDLNELLNNGKILLFLRRITKISVSINGEHNYIIEKSIINKEKYFDEVSLLKNNNETTQWIVTTFEEIPIDNETQVELGKDEKTPDKLKKAKITEISFAARIENKRIKALKGEESLIFTYLPTKIIDFEFPFLVNGNFLTTTNRQEIHTDRIWNISLFRLIAEKSFMWLELLAKTKYKYQILTLIPCLQNSSQNNLKKKFDESFKNASKNTRFILTKNGTLKKITEIIIDKTGFSELDFIEPAILVKYINEVKEANFSNESFVNRKLNQIDRLKELGAKSFETNNIEEFLFSDIFQTTHKLEDNFSLIEFFYQKSDYGENREENERLKDSPFIYAKGKNLRSPKSLCFPSLDFKTKSGDKVTVIHNRIYSQIEKNKGMKNWLEKLEIKEPSDIAYLEKEVLPNLNKLINKTNYKKITRYIYNLHNDKKLKNIHYSRLGELKILCKDKQFYNAVDCFLSNFYSPKLLLEKLYDNNHYVSERYKESYDETTEWKLFFIYIGVSQDISVIRYEKLSEVKLRNIFQCEGSYFRKYWNPEYYPNWRFNFYSLTKITFIEKAKEYNFSKLFWKTLLDSNISISIITEETRGFWGFGEMDGARSGDIIKSYVEWIISNLPIIPTTTKDCFLPSKVFLNTKQNLEIAGKYLPVFDFEEPIQDDWKEFLQFKESLDLNDYLKILEKIQKESNSKRIINKSNINRIGQIYNKLASNLPNYSKEKKGQITEWAKETKFLSRNENFEYATDLVWLDKDGFSNSANHLKLIYVPENRNTKNEYLKELFELFGVTIISDFKLITNETTSNDSLQNELLAISPYLAAVIEKREGVNFEKHFTSLKESIKVLKIIKSSLLELAYIHDGKQNIISRPDSYFDKSSKILYYIGYWESPTTMYSLIEQLCISLKIDNYKEELRLFLQLNASEISDWLESKFDIVKANVDEIPTVLKFIADLVPATEEEIQPSDSGVLSDNSTIKTRISINEEAQEIVFSTLKRNNFIVDKTQKITYTILDGVLNPKGKPIKVVVKSAKAGRIYFTPLEWLALTEQDSQLFVLTAGNKVRNITLSDLQKINDEFHMRFNTEMFVLSNLKILADFFKRLPYSHFIFIAPESTTEYLKEFGLNQRNSSADTLTSDDKNLLH